MGQGHDVGEFYLDEKEPVIIYEALHNPSTCESVSLTLSLHRTREGAERAVRVHKDKVKAEHDQDQIDFEKAGLDPSPFAWDFDLSWGINESELLD